MAHRGGESDPHGAGQLVGRRVHEPTRVALVATARSHVESAHAVAAWQLPESGLDHVQEIARRTLAAPLIGEKELAKLFVLDWMQKHALVALDATACKNQNEQQTILATRTVLALVFTWRTLVWACIFVMKIPEKPEASHVRGPR
jgi:hypothetical protein